MPFSAKTRRLQGYLLGISPLVLIAICSAGEAPTLSGAELYREFCASCHGVKGHGDGPVAPSLRQPVPDLTLLANRRGGAFPAEEIHRIIDGRSMPRAHGSAEMPIWGWEFYGYEGEDATRRRRVAGLIDQLVEYLHSIQSNK
jgi:mono/diheme cytochrome c family protein